MPKLPSVRKQELVDHLVGNCSCDTESLFEPEDVDTLNKLPVKELENLIDNEEGSGHFDQPKQTSKLKRPVAPVVNELEDDEEESEQVFNEADLPADVRADLEFARNARKQQSDQLIAKITANESGLYTKEDLASKSVEELTKIASYVSNSPPAPKPKKTTPRLGMHTPVHVDNEDAFDANDILETPVMNFGS